MKKLLILLLSVSFSFASKAQDTWSLERCIMHAQQNNLTIQQMVVQEKLSEVTMKQSRQNLLPNVSANTNYSYLVGRAINPFTNQFTTESNHSLNFSLSASVVLFDGLRNINTIKRNKLQMMADQEAVERVKRDISLEVGLAFLLVLRNEEILNAAKTQVETTKDQVNRTSKLVAAGSAPEGNLLEIKAQQAQEEASVVDAENQLRIATLNLTQLLQLPSPDGFMIEKPAINDINAESLNVSVQEIYAGIGDLPEIREAKLRLQSAEEALTIAKGAYTPELSASAGVFSGYFTTAQQIVAGTETNPIPELEVIPFNDQINNNLNQQVGLTLRIPIYSQGRIRQQTSNAKIGIMDAKNNIEVVKLRVYQNVQQAHADAQAALARYQSSSSSVEALERSFEYTEQRFTVGAVNTYEFNQAKNDLFRAQADLTQAKYDYIFRLKVLDFYRGKPLKL